MKKILVLLALSTLCLHAEYAGSEGQNVDTAGERQAWREALDLWTTDAVQFGTIELGNASDTTIARIAAGRLSIEGDEIARASTHVPYTGATAGLNLGAFGLTSQLVTTDILYRSGDPVAVADLYYRQLVANQAGISLVIAEWDGTALETLAVTGFGIDPVSLPNGANTLTGAGYTTDGSAAYMPYGIVSGGGIDASLYNVNAADGRFDTIANYTGLGPPSFPSGINLTGGALDMGTYDIDNCYSIYSSSFVGGTSVAPVSASFPQGLTLGAALEAANNNINNVATIYGSAGSFAITYTGGITNVANNGPATIYYGAQLFPTTVAGLTGTEGNISYVTDANAPTIGATVAGGGAAKALVLYNGTNWKVIATP